MNRQEVFHTPRLAGSVQRYHTWPMHQQQSVGEHTWQVMRIYSQVFGHISGEVAQYLIWHDAGELITGDLPFPIKAINPALKVQMDALELAAVVAMHGEVVTLPSDECVRVKACELVEMHEHGRVEFMLGNKFAIPIMDDCWAKFLELPLSKEDLDKFLTYTLANWPAIRGITQQELR